MFSSLSQYLSGNNFSELLDCLGEVTLQNIENTLSLNVKKKITARFLYMKAVDRYNKPNIPHFAGLLRPRIYRVCVPPRIIKALEVKHLPSDLDAFMEALQTETADVLKRARAAKKKKDNTGELGEILVSILLEGIYQAPMIAHKFYSKHNSSANVQGNDGIHAFVDRANKKLTIIFCESKMVEKDAQALKSAMTSMTSYQEERKTRDLKAIASYIDLNVAEPSTKATLEEKLKTYFNSWDSPATVEEVQELNVCFLSYNAELYKALEETQNPEEEIRKRYEAHVNEMIKSIRDSIQDSPIKHLFFHFLILPFEDIHAFIKSCGMKGFVFFEDPAEAKVAGGK